MNNTLCAKLIILRDINQEILFVIDDEGKANEENDESDELNNNNSS